MTSRFILSSLRAFLVAQLVKNLPAIRETWVGSLGWEDPLEKGKATHSSILAWRIPWTVQSRADIPAHGVGKIRIGQEVNVKLNEYQIGRAHV